MTGLQQLAGNLAANRKDWPLRERISLGDLDAIREAVRVLPVSTLTYFYVDVEMLALEEFEQALDWALPLDRPTYRP